MLALISPGLQPPSLPAAAEPNTQKILHTAEESIILWAAPGRNSSNTGNTKAPLTLEAQEAVTRPQGDTSDRGSEGCKLATLNSSQKQLKQEKPKPCAIYSATY